VLLSAEVKPFRSFRRLFVANRGEVAARIARTCDALGIVPVFGVSEADVDAPWTRGRETALLGPARSSESYLARERVVRAAVEHRCSALHPGWGFLAEDAVFATMCESHGCRVGPDRWRHEPRVHHPGVDG
jgi:acetyl-CoA carboxylase biotin carboxylase subunit